MDLISEIIRQCSVAPERTALIEDAQTLSYQDLAQRIKQIAASIDHLPANCQRIAIALDRGLIAATAILGTLYAGKCYIPLDLKNPQDRLAYILSNADVQCIIGRGRPPHWLEDCCEWLDLEAVSGNENRAEQAAPENDNLAAILYTSGSTGSPKGVALSHRAMYSFCCWARQTFSLGPEQRIASLAPFFFDLSIFDLFACLSAGASVHFIPARLTLSPARLGDWLFERAITTWYTVPSLLRFLAYKGDLEKRPLPALQQVLFAGEVFPTPALIRLAELMPQTALYNLYGPTETNVCCYWPVDRSRLLPDKPIPIGVPAGQVQLKINPENRELMVKGNINFAGYWDKGRLDSAPLQDGWYATGDRVSKNKQGEFCYHGRLDRMLKCSGYRVEPAEIESIINHQPGVVQCTVTSIEDESSGQRPAAAVVIRGGFQLAEVVAEVRKKLPAYMHPVCYVEIAELPLLSSGKIDYAAVQLLLQESRG